MKKLKTAILSVLLLFAVTAQAQLFEFYIGNRIADHDDPMRITEISMTDGKIEQISANVGEAIGNELKVVVDMERFKNTDVEDYEKMLASKGKQISTITVANKNRKLKVIIFYGNSILVTPTLKQELYTVKYTTRLGFYMDSQ